MPYSEYGTVECGHSRCLQGSFRLILRKTNKTFSPLGGIPRNRCPMSGSYLIRYCGASVGVSECIAVYRESSVIRSSQAGTRAGKRFRTSQTSPYNSKFSGPTLSERSTKPIPVLHFESAKVSLVNNCHRML